MKSKWIFQNLKTHIPSSFSSLFSSFKPHQSFQESSSFVLTHRDVTQLLSVCGRESYISLATSIHASIIKKQEFFFNSENQDTLLIWNSLLAFYTKNGNLIHAVKVFDQMPVKDTVSWNTLISGLLRNDDLGMGFGMLKEMLKWGLYGLDQATLTITLSACDRPELCNVMIMIHGLAILNGFEREISIGNALITSYFKCECFSSGRKVFDEMLERNVITWTAMISGLAQNRFYKNSLYLFLEMRNGCYVAPNSLTYLSSLKACSGLQALREGRQIHGLIYKSGIQSDLCIESALMDMYSKCGSLKDAWHTFEFAEELDEVSVTIILAGFAQNGFEEEAIQFFVKIVRAGIKIDPNMVSSILGVFAMDTSLSIGKQIHASVIKRKFNSNIFVSNGLVNMYSKCGDLEESIKVFNRMYRRNSVSWNSVIAAFARHGDGYKALEKYDEMICDCVAPTDITFLSLLHACSHMGLIEKGMGFFKSMVDIYGIAPRTEHYSCVVDMLGRAGFLKEAKGFVQSLPEKPDVLIFQSLLGACSIHGNTEIGKYAADQLFLTAPETAAPYILMANMYSLNGKWKERASTIKKMKEKGVVKGTGLSWIEIEKKIHSFVVEDMIHPQAEMIYFVLGGLVQQMIDEGYVPDKRFWAKAKKGQAYSFT